MKRWHVAKSGHRWGVVGPEGVSTTVEGIPALLDTLGSLGRVAVICRNAPDVMALAVWLQDHAAATDGPLPEINARGTGGGSIELAGVRPAGAAYFVTTGRAIVSASDANKCDAGPPPDTDDPQELAKWSRDLHDQWQSTVDALGLRGDKMSAGTAATGLLPGTWIRASAKLAKTEAWLQVREAYAGGRVDCFRPGYDGPAVEYDMRIAYGAALAGLLGPMPDCQLYPGRYPLRAAPAWLDATVRVAGAIAPIPRRDPDRPWRLLWPTSGQWRGWYTAADLDTPGVTVVQVHASHRGRYRHPLRDGIAPLLDRRATASRWDRAVIRQIVVSLSGKLGQRPIVWRLWSPLAPGRRPAGSVHIGDPWGDGLIVYPALPDRFPPTMVPMVASYVTARTRRALFDAIHQIGTDRVIYCDTDSAHAPPDAPAPRNMGPDGGQWAVKEAGRGIYHGRRRYRIGDKRVNC